MNNPSRQINRNTLKMLEPLNLLSNILLDELAAKSVIEDVAAGRTICRNGEEDSRQIYLLEGQVEAAESGQAKIKVIKAKTPYKTPIAKGSPKTTSLKAKTDSTLLYVDSDLLELLMDDGPKLTPVYEVTEVGQDENDSEGDDDWMLTFLQSPAFATIPNDNITKLLMNLDEFSVKKDQVIISQGDKDDNYYIIKSGTCNVHRKPYKGSASVLLTVLTSGNGFGEEALISNGSRNATITMCENGKLMRLRKDDFLNLLINPIISYFENTETKQKVKQGALIIDVRTEQQAKDKPLANSINIPLSMLRMEFKNLNAEREYLLMCNDGTQSAAAAFLMIQGGLVKCSVLKGGLNSVSGAKNTPKPAATDNLTIAPKSDATPQLATAPKIAAATENTTTTDKASTTPSFKLELEPQVEEVENTQKNSEAVSEIEKAIIEQKIVDQYADEQEKIQAKNVRSEQALSKRNKELDESCAKIERKSQQASSREKQAEQLKVKASQELAKAQKENKANQRLQQESSNKMLHAEDILKKSEAMAKQTRNKAKKDAEILKQKALKEAKDQYAGKTAKVQAEREVIKKHQQKTDKAMRDAEKIKKQSEAKAKKIRQKAEQEAALILQRAHKEAKHLQAEKETKESAKVQAELEILKLHQQQNKKAMHRAKKMMQYSESKAEQIRINAEKEAALIKQRATVEAKALHAEVEIARKKIQQDATQFKGKEAQIKHEAEEIRRKALNTAKQARKEIEKTRALFNKKIEQVKKEKQVQQPVAKAKVKQAKKPVAKVKVKKEQKPQKTSAQVKTKKANKKIVSEEKDNLIIFDEPAIISQPSKIELGHEITQRTQAETTLTQISTGKFKTPVAETEVPPKQQPAQSTPFSNQDNSYTETSYGIQQFDQKSFTQKNLKKSSNTVAIAASFLMILAGAIFTLDATDTLKVDSIAAIFNSGNDSAPEIAIAKAKNTDKKYLRADKSGSIKRKVTDKIESFMQDWEDFLNDSKKPKKSNRN